MKNRACVVQSGQNGFTLIEVVIATALLLATSIVFSTMIVGQNRQISNLDNRLARASLESLLIQAFSNSSVCSWQLKDQVFNTSGISSTTPARSTIDFSHNGHQIHMGSSATARGPVLAKQGDPLGNRPHGIIIDRIQISNVTRVSPDQYAGELTVSFRNSSNDPAISLAQIAVPLMFNASGSGSSAKIESCLGSNNSAEPPPGTMCGLWLRRSYTGNFGVGGPPGGEPGMIEKVACNGHSLSYNDRTHSTSGCPAGYRTTMILSVTTELRNSGSSSMSPGKMSEQHLTCTKT